MVEDISGEGAATLPPGVAGGKGYSRAALLARPKKFARESPRERRGGFTSRRPVKNARVRRQSAQVTGIFKVLFLQDIMQRKKVFMLHKNFGS